MKSKALVSAVVCLIVFAAPALAIRGGGGRMGGGRGGFEGGGFGGGGWGGGGARWSGGMGRSNEGAGWSAPHANSSPRLSMGSGMSARPQAGGAARLGSGYSGASSEAWRSAGAFGGSSLASSGQRTGASGRFGGSLNSSVPSMGAYGRGGADTEFDRSGRLAGEGSLARPIGDRASPTQVGDFLGLSQPLQSGRGFTGLAEGRPGTGDLGRAAGREPWQSGDFARPGQPGTFRPGQPGEATWPGKGGSGTERFPNLRLNNAINQRPGWANLDPARANSIQNNWRSAVVNQPNMNRWQNIHPEQIQQYNRWGNNVRRNWDVNVNNFDWHGNVFGPDWWNHHYYPAGGWNYWNNVNRYNYAYWWGGTTWPVMTGWFAWPPTEVMTQPVYYDYGPGGNVTYRNNTVYVNEQPVGTSQEFAQTAAALATVPPPADPQQAAQTEWMPLGTFALSTDSRETTPSRLIQLAVNREGIISGTLYNTQTDQAQAVQGQVDKQTQRVAMRLGESQNVVLETGLYNLTQREAPALIHYGADKTENCLLVRLDAPKTAGAPAGAGNPARSAGTPAAAKS